MQSVACEGTNSDGCATRLVTAIVKCVRSECRPSGGLGTHIVLDFELWDGNSSSKHSVTERVKRGASTHKQKRTPSRPQDVEPTRVVQLRVERVEQLREPAHLLPGRAPRQRRAFSLASVRTLS